AGDPWNADFVGPPVDPDLDKFGAERIGDLVAHLVAADHAYLALVHRPERIHRCAFGLPLAILLDHTDAECVEGAIQIERSIALSGLCAWWLRQADGLLGLVDEILVRHQRLEQAPSDLVAYRDHS